MTTPIPANEHEQKLTISVDTFIADHPDRTGTPVFDHSRKQLIENNPSACCFICGTKDNLELHHRIEWCDSNAVDFKKVALLVPEFNWTAFDPEHPETFIDSIYNANVVLCKKHHIGKDHGIHFLPVGIWIVQKLKKDNFVFSPDEEIPPVAPDINA